MAEGHAKLSLRSKVGVFDAVAAIKLYEENLVQTHGFSPLIPDNQPPMENVIWNQALQTIFLIYHFLQYNEEMVRFWNQLNKVLDHLVGDLSISHDADVEASEE